MSDPWADVRREFKNVGDPFVDRLLTDADALLAVVRVTQIELGMSVPELLRTVANDIETSNVIEAQDVLAMWLRRMADELEKTLAALPEYLK